MPTTQDNARGKRAAHFTKASDTAKAAGSAQDGSASTGVVTPPRSARRSASRATGATRPVQATSSTHMSERTALATKRAAAAHKRRSQGTHPSTKAKRHNSIAVALLAVMAVAAVVGVGFLVVPHLFQRVESGQEDYPSGEQVIVTVPDGAGGSQIAAILIENHVISDETAFYQEIQKQNADATMKSGTYQFVTGATPSEVVRQLVSGPNATEYRLKLAEGLSVTQTAEQVEAQLGIDAKEFVEQAKASNYVDDYPFLSGVDSEYDTLEGYLFAKTYDLGGTDMTADSVIRAMLDQYQTEVGMLDFEAARTTLRDRYNIEISDYGIIKLASIIEREALTDEERPLVSSVFYNRLGRPFPGMGYVWPYLQSDATMMYVVDGEVTQADNQTDSPYSTYTNQNLPPTPICSPSLPSIQAALEPAETDYFFFYIKPNYSAFSETAEEHEQAQADYAYSQSEDSDE